MRRFGVLGCSMLLVAACSGSPTADDASAPSVTDAPDATASLPTTSTTAATTTTAQPATTALSGSSLEHAVLIVGDAGVHQIDGSGRITHLVDGPVAYAVDDTQGGLLYQLQRGRHSSSGADGVPAGGATIVWWIPAEGAAPQELLVPTPGEVQSLTLHDAVQTADSFAVVYERHEGTIPYASDSGEADMADRLRVYDVASGNVNEIYRTRGHEWWLSTVTAGDGLIAATEVQILGQGCRLFDDANAELVTRPGFPSATPECFDESTECVASCALSSDAGMVVYGLPAAAGDGLVFEITVADIGGGSAPVRFSIPIQEPWGIGELDIAGGSVLVNRHSEATHDLPALLIDLGDVTSEPSELPIAGRARFATEPVSLSSLVAAPAAPGSRASYYRYGDEGLFRVVDGIETQLRSEPVDRAWDDHMGGVVIADSAASEILHLRRGYTAPVPILWETGYGYAQFTGMVDGRAVLFYAGMPDGVDPDDWPCGDWSLNSRDLTTGEDRFHLCLPIEDAILGIQSVGGGVLVGAPLGMCGGPGTSSSIQFWDLDGSTVEMATNPFSRAESCVPCELDALIAPGGNLLAYRYRPDAFWPTSPFFSGMSCGGGDEQVDAWWERSRHVAAEVAVVDLASGEPRWKMEVWAAAHLSDFDGRFLVVASSASSSWPPAPAPTSTVFDTSGVLPPISVVGDVVLMRRTPEVEDVVLRPDGLGPVAFGEPAESAVAALVALLGPAGGDELIDPEAEGVALPHGYAADRYFRNLWWPDHALGVVFSDESFFRDDAVPHFIGWYLGAPGLATAEGISVGSTIGELRAAYGDSVETWHAETCVPSWWYRVDFDGSLHRLIGLLDGEPSDPATKLTGLNGGAIGSC